MRRHYPHEQEAWLPDVLSGVDVSTQQALREMGRYVEVEAGEQVAGLAEHAVRLESGLVSVAVSSGERKLTVGILGPNDMFLSSMYHPWEIELYRLTAQEPTEIRLIPRDELLAAAAQNPTLNANIIRHLSWACWHYLGEIHMLAFFNLPQRVARVLINLATMFGRLDERGGIRLGLRFTQEELAELAGARRETLSTVLQEFREDGILDLRYARIDIKDIDALHKMAGVDPLPFLKKPQYLG